MYMDQTYAQNQANKQNQYHKRGKDNIAIQPTEKISINAVGVQSVNGNSFISFLDNTKTFEMMKFMISVVFNNTKNSDLKVKLKNIINSDDLLLENILNTINQKENYDNLLLTLEELSQESKTFEKLYERMKNNPYDLKTKSVTVLENLQKAMLLTYFNENKLHQDVMNEKPIAMILDNYSVHHALPFKKLCNALNMELIYLPPYSPKYNPIEQVWRTIKAIISREYITSKESLRFRFEREFVKVVDNSSYWDGWCENFICDYNI